MKLKKILLSLTLVMILIIAGCGVNEDAVDNSQGGEQVSNSAINYNITKEVLELNNKNSKIFYPQVKDYPGELLKDYMNQSLRKIADLYAKDEQYTDMKIDYQTTRMDEILSVLFKGTGKINGSKEITIQQSINLDMASSNEIVYNNFIKNDNKSNEEVMKILNEKAKAQGIKKGVEAEGIRIYFTEKDVIFYYYPLDDSVKECVELRVPLKEIKAYINTDFGTRPAS